LWRYTFVLNRTKNISPCQQVICLSQWFIMICLRLCSVMLYISVDSVLLKLWRSDGFYLQNLKLDNFFPYYSVYPYLPCAMFWRPHKPLSSTRKEVEATMSSPLVFSGVRVTRSLVLCVCFVDHWHYLSFCTFSFGHCVVCSSSIYGFW